MRILLKTLIVSALMALTACSHNVSTALPTAGSAEPKDQGRLKPDERLQSFNKSFRASQGATGGAGALANPATVRPVAAWQYVFLARDFLAARDSVGAIRAYWAALTLSSTTVASRADRARLRRASYQGLGAIESARGYPRYGEMLAFSASLADMYVATPQAQHEHEAFYRQIDQIRSVQASAEAQQSEASRNAWFGALGAVVASAGSVAAQQQGDKAKADQFKHQADSALSAGSHASDSISAKLQPVLDALMNDSRQFRESVSREMSSVEAGQPFLAEELGAFLSITDARATYFPLLNRFAEDKPPVKVAVDAYVHAPDNNSLQRLQQVFRQYELWVAQNERRHTEVPPI